MDPKLGGKDRTRGRGRGETEGGMSGGREKTRQIMFIIFITDPVSIKGEKLERVTLMASPLTQKAKSQDEADITATTQHS